MSIQRKIKYEVIAGSDPPQEVFPINDTKLEFSYDSEENQIFFQRKLKTALEFSNNPKESIADFTFFHDFEIDTNNRCETFTLNIFKLCSGVYILDWTGEFGLNDAEWDLDQCKVKIKADPVSIYTCLKKKKTQEVNILDITNVVTTYANLDYSYEYFYCYDLSTLPSCSLPGANPGTWTQAFQNLTKNLTYQCTNYSTALRIYYREFVITACVGGVPQPPPGAGWLLETNNCSTTHTSKYVRIAISGPFPATQFAYGWWNYINNIQELPPEPSFKSIVVTNTPASQTSFFLGHNRVVFPFGGTPAPVVDYYFEVLNNANSTYVWSLDGTSPIAATITGTGNLCKVTPTVNATGNIIVKLTETHGNGYVSTHLFMIPQIVASAGFSQTQTASITGHTSCIPNQSIFFRCTPINTADTGNPTPTWVVTGGTITGGQGTDQISVDAGASGTVNVSVSYAIVVAGAPVYTITCSASTSCAIAELPITEPLYVVNQVYPGETIGIFSYGRSASTWDVYRNTTQLTDPSSFGLFVVLSTPAPGSTGTYCYLFKEHVAIFNNWVQIVPPVSNATVQYLPAVYWAPDTSTLVTYDRNRMFKGAVEYLLAQLDCGTSKIVSDYFGWNPIGDAPGYSLGKNYVLVNEGFSDTFNYLTNITIAQKSDIIDPTSSNAATKGMLTLEKLEKLLLFKFNAYWFIDQYNNFRIEHDSFFQRTVAFNCNASPHATFNAAKNKYTYDKTKMPKYEKYTDAEMFFTDFIGTPIYYDNLCVDQEVSSNTKEYALEFLTTDLYALFLEPDDANKEGFVLICNVVTGTGYVVAIETGQISGSPVVNGHLSWANLHNNYHRHGRVLIKGYMNNNLETFESARPVRVQKNMVIKKCCDEDFDPLLQLYQSELGDGQLKDGTEEPYNGIIKMTLLHQAP